MVKYVLGHKNPDTDSICAAILYSNLLNKIGDQAIPVSLGELNKETKHVLAYININAPKIVDCIEEGSQVVLVDHNEKNQSIDNIDMLNISHVIDHHKIDLKTEKPITIVTEPVGSTCSIIAGLFKQYGLNPTKEESLMIISAIISDTLHFRSPTTTQKDIDIVNELNQIAMINDLNEYANSLFEAKSDLGDMNTESIIRLDFKEYEFLGNKYGIGVIETTSPNSILKRKLEIVEALEEIKNKDGLKGILLSVIDILNEKNTTIISDDHEAEIIRAAFNGEEIEEHIYSLGNIISRKKQIIPVLEKYFTK